MARTHRQQARCASPAGAGAAAAMAARPAGVGHECDAGQSGRSPASALRPDQRSTGARACGQGAGHRHADPARAGSLLVGRPPRRAHAGAGGQRAGHRQHRAGVHQHAQPGRDLVPDAAGPAARLGRAGGPAPRQPGQGSARVGGAGLEDRPAQGRGRHVLARPRRRFFAGGAGAADRLGQRGGAPVAARRAQRPRTGAAQPRHAGAHQHAGAGGSGRRARSRPGRPCGEPAQPRPAAGRAGAAPGHRGAGRGLPSRRLV